MFDDEVYKMAAVAAALMGPGRNDDPQWDEVADWAMDLLKACNKRWLQEQMIRKQKREANG